MKIRLLKSTCACNFEGLATESGYCDYPESGLDCEGNCLLDSDSDGVCDSDEVNGCTNSTACNYTSAASDDDGSCVFAQSGQDCNGNCLFDTDSDGVPNQYLAPSASVNTGQIVAILLEITANSINDAGSTEADGLLRRTFRQTIKIRNAG